MLRALRRLTDRYCHHLVALFCGLRAIVQHFVSRPATGMADNGDFHWVTDPMGLQAVAAPNERFFNSLVRYWDTGPVTWPANPATEQLFVLAARGLSGWGERFDLAWFGGFQAVILLVGVMWLLDEVLRDEASVLRRGLVALLVCWVVFDPVRVAMLRSFFFTAATAVLLPWVLAAFVRVYRDGRVTPTRVVVATTLSCLLVFSKAQLAPCAIGLAWLMFRWRGLATYRRDRRLASAAALVIVLAGAWQYSSARRASLEGVYRANVYRAFFSGLALVAESPDVVLADFGLASELGRLRGTDAYSAAAAPLFGPELEPFFERVTFPRLLRYYLSHPRTLGRLLTRGAQTPFIDRDYYLLPAHMSRESDDWSAVRGRYTRPAVLFACFAAISLVGVTMAVTSRTRQRRRGGGALFVLSMCAAAQFAVVMIASGFPDVARHLDTFSLLFEWALLLSMIAVARVVPGWPAAGRRARAFVEWPANATVVLNCALFLPRFVGQGTSARWTPLMSVMSGAERGVGPLEALFVSRANADVFRVSVEFLAVVALLVWFPVSRAARVLAAVLYTTLLGFLAYHHTYAAAYRTVPALWEDAQLLPSLLGYVSESFGRWSAVGLVLAVVFVLVATYLAVGRVFAALQQRATARVRAATLVLLVAGLLVWSVTTQRGEEAVVQSSARAVLLNFHASSLRRQQLAELKTSGVDARMLSLQRARLFARPRVYLLMIEAYGQRLLSDPALSPAFQVLAERVSARLAAAGFSTRTAFSDAPVYGGKSWLSVATVQTGVRIETPSLYDEMEPSAARLGTITNFFKSQGYRTVSLQPGNYRNDMRFPDPYARDRQYAFKDLRYNGPAYGYVGVPDQHSLRVFTEDVLSQERGPTFMFYLSISTHHPFPSIPFEGGGPWPSIPGVEAIPADGAHRAYFNTVEYEWRCLLEFIDRVADDDAVFFIIGDHQPLLERTMDDVQELTVLQSSNTPVHVISRNAAFLQRFEKYGFQPGLAPPPGTGGLRHEGLASLFVHEFVGQFGGEAQQRHTQYYPDGIGLGGLVAPASRDVGAGSERDGAQEQQGR